MSDKMLDTLQLINGAAILISFYVGYKYAMSTLTSTISKSNKDEDETEKQHKKFLHKVIPDSKDYKMVFIVRNDLKMGKGKIAAQCGHAAIGAYTKAKIKIPNILTQWEYKGCTKIALKIESDADLMQLKKVADQNKFVTSLIRDAGRTQIEPNTKTVLAIGPALSKEIDKITGHLKLL